MPFVFFWEPLYVAIFVCLTLTCYSEYSSEVTSFGNSVLIPIPALTELDTSSVFPSTSSLLWLVAYLSCCLDRLGVVEDREYLPVYLQPLITVPGVGHLFNKCS